MRNLALRGALAFGIPVILVFAFSAFYPQSYYYLAAGPLCGVVGGLAFGRRWALATVLGLLFATIAFMFLLQDIHSAWFSDVIWTGLVTGFLFWVAGACAMLTLPPPMRFNGAAAFGIPGTIAGIVFQFFYGPARFRFDLGSQPWWTNTAWEHLLLWLIAGAGGGALMGWMWKRHEERTETEKAATGNRWAWTSIACGALGLGIGGFYFLRSTLPLGLFNSLSPATVAADWLWGWGILGATAASIAVIKPNRRWRAAAGMALAFVLALVSYRVDGNPWKSQFNSKYAQKLLRDEKTSGDAIYAGNLILAQAALDNNDPTAAKQFLLEAAATPGAKRIEQNGLDTSVARVLFDRGEKDAVLEYLQRGRTLWPQGAQIIGRWEAAIRAGRRPNFNTRGPGGAAGAGGAQDR